MPHCWQLRAIQRAGSETIDLVQIGRRKTQGWRNRALPVAVFTMTSRRVNSSDQLRCRGNNVINLSGGLLANGSTVRRGNLELKPVGWRESLRGRAKNPLELAAEVRLAGELQFGRGRFVGVSLRDQFFCQTTLQVAKPMARGAIKIAPENPLQLTLRNGAE